MNQNRLSESSAALLKSIVFNTHDSLDNLIAAIERWAHAGFADNAGTQWILMVLDENERPIDEFQDPRLKVFALGGFEFGMTAKGLPALVKNLEACAVIAVSFSGGESVLVQVEDVRCGLFERSATATPDGEGQPRLGAFTTQTPMQLGELLAPWPGGVAFPRRELYPKCCGWVASRWPIGMARVARDELRGSLMVGVAKGS